MEVRAKKSLGQNFLIDDTVVEKIFEVAGIQPDDIIFEVGPGTGALTEKLSQRAKKVVALELDHQLVTRLQEHFEKSEGVSILEGNILEVNMNEMLEHADFPHRGYKIVANLPYYITAPIIRTLLSLDRQPQSLTLMVQKEVAERITAAPGDMSLLSLMAQFYCDTRLAFVVPGEAFEPVPEVESAVIHLVPKKIFDDEEDRKLFRIARAGFAARRKTLANNLASSFKKERSEIEALLEKLGLRKDIRAQALSVENWQQLEEALEV